MKNYLKKSSNEAYAEMHAHQAIQQITKWIDERYPKISALTKTRIIAQCLIEVRREKYDRIHLN